MDIYKEEVTQQEAPNSLEKFKKEHTDKYINGVEAKI